MFHGRNDVGTWPFGWLVVGAPEDQNIHETGEMTGNFAIEAPVEATIKTMRSPMRSDRKCPNIRGGTSDHAYSCQIHFGRLQSVGIHRLLPNTVYIPYNCLRVIVLYKV